MGVSRACLVPTVLTSIHRRRRRHWRSPMIQTPLHALPAIATRWRHFVFRKAGRLLSCSKCQFRVSSRSECINHRVPRVESQRGSSAFGSRDHNSPRTRGMGYARLRCTSAHRVAGSVEWTASTNVSRCSRSFTSSLRKQASVATDEQCCRGASRVAHVSAVSATASPSVRSAWQHGTRERER